MNMPATPQRLHIDRSDLQRCSLLPDPDAPATRPLQPGQVRLEVQHFALTANNITYAAFGKAMKYWQFFPAADAAMGCLPVWGFATVVESQAAGAAPGQRVYGYLPAGSHLVVQPGRITARGFIDLAAHRQELAAIYNQYSFCESDPGWQADQEGLQAVLRPLFMTGFLIDDFMADNQFFGASQMLLSSASSKTAFGTAFCMARRLGRGSARGLVAQPASGPQVSGLTSRANLAFTQSLGCYAKVAAYEALAQLDATQPTVYIDFSGNAALRQAVHTHFGPALKFSSSIGGTHWQALGSGSGLPGPRPTLFFAPAQAAKRSAAPPQGWGRAQLEQRMGLAWSDFIQQVQASAGQAEPWVQIVERRGASAMQAAYLETLNGLGDPRQGLMIDPRG